MSLIQVNNPFYTLKLSEATGDEKFSLAKTAFLYVIRNYSAFKFNKLAMLKSICEICPEITRSITDEELLETAREFSNKGEMRSTAEMNWVVEFIKSPDVQKEVEKMIYRQLLCGSNFFKNARLKQEWSLSSEEKEAILEDVLTDQTVNSKVKVELAEEFGKDKREYAKPYYKKLLWDRHYDVADKLGIVYPDVIIQVVNQNISAGYFADALEVAERFLPEKFEINGLSAQKTEIIEKIKKIISALKV